MGQGQGPILPLQSCNGREWPLNCMTVISAWWRLNIRFKDPVGDRVGVELLFNSVEFGSQKQLPVEFQTVETKCGREGHTRPRGPSGKPRWSGPQHQENKTQRDGHNSGVKIWGLCSISSILSNANLTNKVRGIYFVKEVFLCLPSFMRNSSCVVLHASVFDIESLWYGKWVYICIQQKTVSPLEKWNFIFEFLTHGCASDGQPARTYLHQLCTNTKCTLDDLPKAIEDRDGW